MCDVYVQQEVELCCVLVVFCLKFQLLIPVFSHAHFWPVFHSLWANIQAHTEQAESASRNKPGALISDYVKGLGEAVGGA